MIKLEFENSVRYVDKIESVEIRHWPIRPCSKSLFKQEDNYRVHVNDIYCFSDKKAICDLWVKGLFNENKTID